MIRIPNISDEKLSDPEAERARRQHADAIRELKKAAEDLDRRALPRRWAEIYMSADQNTIANDTTVTFNRILASTGGFSANAGLIRTPPGWWRFRAGLSATPSTAIAVQSQWLENAGLASEASLTLSRRGISTASGNSDSGGPAGEAVAYIYVREQALMGVKAFISAGTVNITSTWSKVRIEEVDPWELE